MVCHSNSNGLPLNAALKDLLSYKPIKVSRGKLYDSLLKSLDDIQKKHNLMKVRKKYFYKT